jgi:ribosome-associated protein
MTGRDQLMQRVEIRGEFITLGQLLKLAGLIGSGGEVRDFLSASEITVNGEPDNRRGRKIRPGDIVSVGGEQKLEIVGGGVADHEAAPTAD